MKKPLNRYKWLLVCLLLLGKWSVAQFAQKAALPPVTTSGYYKILLPPAVTAKAKLNLSDLRIEDANGKQVPYILKKESPVINEQELKTFELQPASLGLDSNTQVIMNIAGATQAVSNASHYSVILVMKKANAYREAVFSGSDDNKNWYAVADRVILDAGAGNTAEHSLQAITLPLGKYKFLKLVMKDKGLQALQVVKAGISLNKNIYGQYQQVPTPAIQQKDSSNRNSYIKLSFNDAYPVGKISFKVQQPALYKRSVSLYDTTGGKNQLVGETILQPGTDSIIISGFKSSVMLAVIENFDNPPLQFSEIKGYQLRQYLIANLQPQQQYAVVMGNEKATAPVYDLEYFANSIQVQPQELTPGVPEINPNAVTAPPTAKKGLPQGWLWTIIIIALLGLLWMSSRLIKDMAKNKQS